MTRFLLLLFLLAQGSVEADRVTHLPPNRSFIDGSFGGTRLDVINGPKILHLPKIFPKADAEGNAWIVKVHNLGPSLVTVEGQPSFSVSIPVGATVRIESTGSFYRLHY